VIVDVSDAAGLVLEVRDDGIGFDPTGVAHGLGLRSIRDRLAAVGGEVAIVSSLGHGARVIARIPCGPRSAAAAQSRSEAAPPG
jgi:signal transduction histidine kinase